MRYSSVCHGSMRDDRFRVQPLLDLVMEVADLVDRAVHDLTDDDLEALRASLQRAYDAAGGEVVRRGTP